MSITDDRARHLAVLVAHLGRLLRAHSQNKSYIVGPTRRGDEVTYPIGRRKPGENTQAALICKDQYVATELLELLHTLGVQARSREIRKLGATEITLVLTATTRTP